MKSNTNNNKFLKMFTTIRKTSKRLFEAIPYLILLFGIGIANSLTAQVTNVPLTPTANQLFRIQQAVDNATDGSTIQLEAGTYVLNGALNLSKSITIKGATPSGFAPRRAGSSGTTTILNEVNRINIRSNDVDLEDLTINSVAGNNFIDILIDARHPTYLLPNPNGRIIESYTGIDFTNIVLSGSAYSFQSGNGVGGTMTNVAFIEWRRIGYWANRLGRSNATPEMIFTKCSFRPDTTITPLTFDNRGISFDAGNSEYPVVWDLSKTQVKECFFKDNGIAYSRCENSDVIGCTFNDSAGEVDQLHIEEFSNNITVQANTFNCSSPDPNKRTFICVLDRELQIVSDLDFIGNTINGDYNFFISAYAAQDVRILRNDFVNASAANDFSIGFTFYESSEREPIERDLVSKGIIVRNNKGLELEGNKAFAAIFSPSDTSNDIRDYTPAQQNIRRIEPLGAEFEDGTYEIVSVASGEKLATNATNNGLRMVPETNDEDISQWNITFKPPYSYIFQNKENNNYLETHVGYTENQIQNDFAQNIFPFLTAAGTALPFWALRPVSGTTNQYEIFPGGNERQSLLSLNGGSPKLSFAISIDRVGVRTNLDVTDNLKWIIRPVSAADIIDSPTLTTLSTTGGASTGGAPIGKIISLRKSGGDRKFVSTVSSLDNSLKANSTSVSGNSQKFRVMRHPNGGVALFSLSARKYVHVIDKNPNIAVKSKGSAMQGWERFEWKSKGDGKVALKSLHSNRWLQAAHNQNNVNIHPKGPNDQGWETFDWKEEVANVAANAGNKIPFGQTISLRKSGGDRKYVSTIASSDNSLSANAASVVDDRQKFRVFRHPKGGVALFSVSAKRYIQVFDKAQNIAAKAKGTNANDWERFEWKSKGNGNVALKSLHSNKWLQAPYNQNNVTILPKGSTDKGWETFQWKTISSKSIGVVESKQDISIYPNPASDFVNINTSLKNGKVVVFDLSGKSIMTIIIGEDFKDKISISDLDSGMYIFSIQDLKGTEIKSEILIKK